MASTKSYVAYKGCSPDIASSYFFRPSKVTEHITSRVTGGQLKTFYYLLLFFIIKFVLIMIFTALIFLRLIHYTRR